MAVKFRKPVISIESVAPGKIAPVRIETGRRLMKAVLKVQATGQVLNEIIEYVEIEVGGKRQRKFTPDEYETEMAIVGEDSSTKFKAQSNTAGSLIKWPIWFREPWRKGWKAGEALAWPTGDVADDEFIIFVKLLSSAHSSVTLACSLEYDNPVDGSGNALAMGDIIKIYQEDIEVTGSTKKFKLPRDRGDLVCFTLHDGDISLLTLVADDIPVRKLDEDDMVSDLAPDGMTAVTDKFHVALDGDDNIGGSLIMRNRKNVYLDIELSDATPRNIRGVFQYIGPRD